MRKANNTTAFLQRNLHQCPRKTKELCYKTPVRPQMEYASIIWDPYTINNIRSLEMVQRRAARFVTGDYHRSSSVTRMLEDLDWPTLRERRAENKAIIMYRIVNNMVAIPSQYLIPTATAITGHNHRFFLPYARSQTYQHSFFPSSIRLWNKLPSTVIGCHLIIISNQLTVPSVIHTNCSEVG